MGFPKKDPMPLELQQEKESQASTTIIAYASNNGNEFEDEFGQIEDDDLMNPDEVCLRGENIIRGGNRIESGSRPKDNALSSINCTGPPDMRQMPRQQSMPAPRPPQGVGPLGQGNGQRLTSQPQRSTVAPIVNGPSRPLNNGNRGPPEVNQISRGQSVNNEAGGLSKTNPPMGSVARPVPTAESLQRNSRIQQHSPNTSTLNTNAPIQEKPQRPPQNQTFPLNQTIGHGVSHNYEPNQRPLQNQQQQQQQTVEQKSANGIRPAHEPPVGFFSARVAETLTSIDPNNNALVNNVLTSGNLPAFNPRAESGIRRTSGINHAVSGPIKRQSITGATGQQNGVSPGPATNQTPTKPNFVNPQADSNRKIGMPGAMGSPMANRGAYKPPGPALGKRGPETLSRPALGDVTNVQTETVMDGGDFKRPKVDETNPHIDSIGK
jgi:DNA repair and recombination protein RAD52